MGVIGRNESDVSLGELVWILLHKHRRGHDGLLDKKSSDLALDGCLLEQDKEHIRAVVGKDPAARKGAKTSIRMMKTCR